MKCVHCGFELKIESGYCEKCGTEVRVVPDFNALDDMIETALNPNETLKGPKKKQQSTVSDETRVIDTPISEDENDDAKMLRRISIFGSVAIAIIILTVLVIFISRSGSYPYQIKAAQKAYAAGKTEKAVVYYTNALDMMQTLDVNETLGHIYADDLSSDLALQYYITACQMGSSDLEIYEWLTYYYLKDNNENGINELLTLASSDEIKNRILDIVPVYPKALLESGDYEGTRFVELEGSGHNLIYYTTDGSNPDKENGVLYEEPIELPVGATVIKFCSYSDISGIYSAVNEAEYFISVDPPANPIINVASGIYAEAIDITVYCADADATIRYTWNGASPNELSAIYTGPLQMPEGENTLRVIAINSYGFCSKVVEATYRCGEFEQ